MIAHLAPEKLRRRERRRVQLHRVAEHFDPADFGHDLRFTQAHEEMARRARTARAGVEALGTALLRSQSFFQDT